MVKIARQKHNWWKTKQNNIVLFCCHIIYWKI